jgi:inner membrane protein
LDALTDGGLGVAFFSPFDNGRYFFSWRPVHVSPIGAERFFNGGRAWDILGSEFVWIWIPTIFLLTLTKVAGLIFKKAGSKP